MFQTTIWEVVHAAGDGDSAALAKIAEEYRAPILAFIRGRGIDPARAEDLCQDVFVRLLTGEVLAKADPDRGRFRSLLCTVTIRVLQDWNRRHRGEAPLDELDPAGPVPSFDRLWTLHLVERAFAELRRTSPVSAEVLREHLQGGQPHRNKLWIARKKLAALVRQQVALTCRTPAELEEELASLAPYLRPGRKERPDREE
ncbi:MAG TPA: sigma-70 family RNA polymerase sigma factor [Vicinamibacterales bacterium]